MALSIECWYDGRRTFFRGVDRLKQMWVLTDAEGSTFYLTHLENITFKDHYKQRQIFNK